MQTVKQLFSIYQKRCNLAESSITIKERAVQLFLDLFGDLAVGQISEEHAEAYKASLLNGRRSKSSANIYLANLKPFFAWLAAKDYIGKNPFALIKKYQDERKVRPIFTPTEIQRILAVADARWTAIVLLSARHSLRRSEILNVCRPDIQGKWLHVCSKRQRQDGWQWQIKNYAESLVLLSQPVTDAFAELQAELPIAQPYLLVKPRMYRQLMHLQAENSLTWQLRNCPYSNFDRSFKTLLKRASVFPRRFQDLRASYCTQLLKGGMRLDEVSRLMRHSTIQTTQQFYTRYEPRELAEKSDEIMNQFYAAKVL